MTTNFRLAFVFPGQGSQSKGMLFDLSADFRVIQDTFQTASDVLGYDLWDLIQNDSALQLNQTEYTQPALLAASVALWRTYLELGYPMPEIMAGHSLGEYSALVCAESLTFEDALQLVATRGRLMQKAVPNGVGAMAAILGMTGDAVVDLCLQVQAEGLVSAANFNSLEQTVIAGDSTAVEAAMQFAKEKGAKRAIKLPVSVPSHCALMKEAANELSEHLKAIAFHLPKITVLRNIDACPHEQGDSIRQALMKQLYQPVQWVKTIQVFSKQGIQAAIECGPGAVLTGLIKRIDPDLKVESIQTPQSLEKASELIGSYE
ncbi:MAG: ACP S-malonyltransferase [Gammaproteobacteria bacterium]